jgi:hypothetical protein
MAARERGGGRCESCPWDDDGTHPWRDRVFRFGRLDYCLECIVGVVRGRIDDNEGDGFP